MLTDLNLTIAIATARIIAGILFFFQGYDKVFKVGIKEVSKIMKLSLGNRNLSDSFLVAISTVTSWIELVCGILLILGLLKYFALYLLCLNLILVVAGFSMSKPMWDTGHVFIRLTLLLLLLLTPIEWDKLSLDYLLALLKLKA